MSRRTLRMGTEPRIDLDTVRETLAYIEADMAPSPRLARIRQALANALAEIDAVNAADNKDGPAGPESTGAVLPFARYRPRFVPWSPG